MNREINNARGTLRQLVNGANTGCLSPERFKYLTARLGVDLDEIERATDPDAPLQRARAHVSRLAVIDGDRP